MHKSKSLEDVSKGVCREGTEEGQFRSPGLAGVRHWERRKDPKMERAVKQKSSETEGKQAEEMLRGPREKGLQKGGVMGTVQLC